MAGRLLLVTMAAGPRRGRLGAKVLYGIELDDVAAVSGWLQDATTHIEDTEAGKHQTALIVAARHSATRVLQLPSC